MILVLFIFAYPDNKNFKILKYIFFYSNIYNYTCISGSVPSVDENNNLEEMHIYIYIIC